MSIDFEENLYVFCAPINSKRTEIDNREGMNEMNIAEAFLKAIIELIEKRETLKELRQSVKRIMGDQ